LCAIKRFAPPDPGASLVGIILCIKSIT